MMQDTNFANMIDEAIDEIDEISTQATDGKWLECLTAEVAPHLPEWDVDESYLWPEWHEREEHLPFTSRTDVGIDVVAKRKSDGAFIAIQCKARKLDADGKGNSIAKGEVNDFAIASIGPLWSERWIVTNGDVPVSDPALEALSTQGKPIKLINIAHDLMAQRGAYVEEKCQHCEAISDPNILQDADEFQPRTKSCMQDEAVETSVRILKQHAKSTVGGSPLGQARGKIILPCGTGKTRISLRIVEELTNPGQFSVVLCPSIALVAQIRREYLTHSKRQIRALAVCSDPTAGHNAKREGPTDVAANPTADAGSISADEVIGKVTTDPAEIGEWIRVGQTENRVSVIFGTYQSGHRIARALRDTRTEASVLIADEAHRTAGLRRKRASSKGAQEFEEIIKNFTLCHDNQAFPATYRVYQTATPRIYDTSKVRKVNESDYIVRDMDDIETFGVELYRKSYVEAVQNEWLSDYRIIAVGINDTDAYQTADNLARDTESKGRQRLSSTHYLRGLAFALSMAGGTVNREADNVPIKSCIGFMNTVDKSKNMAKDLQSEEVRKWVKGRMAELGYPSAADYAFEHLDASSNTTARDQAKDRLAAATDHEPHGILNVGIFGEGTDSPSLSAVAFLEARKSPIDVIQAVGRAMRTSPGKERGYIVCPILIPPNVDPESWLSTSDMDEGWQELGEILLALRAHDTRIEDDLSKLIEIHVPPAAEKESFVVAVAHKETRRMQYGIFKGGQEQAQRAAERIAKGDSTRSRENVEIIRDEGLPFGVPQPTQIIAVKQNEDGSVESRIDSVGRKKPPRDEPRGEFDFKKSKDKAKKMVNEGTGILLERKRRKRPDKPKKPHDPTKPTQHMMRIINLLPEADSISMNLLSKSGLVHNRVIRDLNILESSVKEAAFHLRSDGLQSLLDKHFKLDNLKDSDLNKQADGCTIAALLMMNAAMLHQRISNDDWLVGIPSLASVKNDVNVVRSTRSAWSRILRHDFRPVLEPPVDAIEAIESSGKTSGLERALHHIAAEAERIAETYADMGADHAGPLFNRVMGNQESDGAFFTRPVAASMAARLTLDALGDQDWTDPKVWQQHKTVDLACGSGTLLAAMLTEMKRRAVEQGADEARTEDLQKLAVEEVIKGMDINPVSLQLAASQLTTGNRDIRYRKMGLHLMPYGPNQHDPNRVSAGSLELLGQRAIVNRRGELDFPDDAIGSQHVWESNDAELEDAVDAANNAKIVIMNPPFSNRTNIGDKFTKSTQLALRSRIDDMEQMLIRSDPDMEDFVDKNALGPLFVALGDRCLGIDEGIVTLIHPTIALTNPSGLRERSMLAQRFHVHTILTCHQPANYNLVQGSNINESIILLKRHDGPKPQTCFIQLDKLPADFKGATELLECITRRQEGEIEDGWGEVSYWPAERIQEGDWTPAIWRSPELAAAAAKFANATHLFAIKDLPDVQIHSTYQTLYGKFQKMALTSSGSFPILASTGATGQKSINSCPDEYWGPKSKDQGMNSRDGDVHPVTQAMLEKAGHLLVTMAQDNRTGRLTATASDGKYVGIGFLPVSGLTPAEAKAAAVFINSTPGRLQLMRNPSRKLEFPRYNPAASGNIKIPDVKDDRVRQILTSQWERTRDVIVPQFRDGECEVRRLWDEAVAEAMGWDADELTRLRHLLYREPHVRGLGYNQYADEVRD